jgi:hypothetical protein
MVCLDCHIFLLVLRLCLISYADIINKKIFHFWYLLHRQQDIIFVVCIPNMVRHCVCCPYPINGEISNFLHLSCDRCVALIINCFSGLSSNLTVNRCLHYKNHSPKCIHFHVKCLLFLSSFNKNWNELTYFVKIPQKISQTSIWWESPCSVLNATGRYSIYKHSLLLAAASIMLQSSYEDKHSWAWYINYESPESWWLQN